MTGGLSRGSAGGFETVVLQNARIRAVVIPALGGRVWELEDLERQRQWIWHRDDVPLKASTPGDVYDDVWAGGWEELFPNDAPGWFEGRELPDHGEWWTLPWTVLDSTRDATLSLGATASVVKASLTKEIRLGLDASLTVSYRIRSLERDAFHFLFKQHLPVRLTPTCRLALPGGRAEAVDPSFGTLLPGPEPFDWPLASRNGRTADMRVVPARTARAREFVYIRNLPRPWCGVEDLDRKASLRLSFERSHLPFVWLFLSYGGWRDTYTAVLEPCTNMPKDLADAVRLGQSARLGPGEEFRTTVSVTLGGLTEPDR